MLDLEPLYRLVSLLPFECLQAGFMQQALVALILLAPMASTMGVQLSIAFNRKASTGLFSGEGFIMQRLSGQGTAFVEIDGEVIQYRLEAGQQMVVDTGNVAAFEPSVSIDVQTVKGMKNKLLGGEGFFNTVLTGPGRIWLQTMPISNIAGAIAPFISTN